MINFEHETIEQKKGNQLRDKILVGQLWSAFNEQWERRWSFAQMKIIDEEQWSSDVNFKLDTA